MDGANWPLMKRSILANIAVQNGEVELPERNSRQLVVGKEEM